MNQMLDQALVNAINGGDIDAARRLLHEGANPNAPVTVGRKAKTTPLIEAAASKACGPEMIQALLDAGAESRTSDQSGYGAEPRVAEPSVGS